jgi:DNA polymerase-4/protein ImuB
VLDRPELDGVPLALSARPGGRPVVTDRTPEAAAHGVQRGMTVREATALCPEVVILLPNPAREAAVREALLDRLETISPLVEPNEEEPGCCYVDLRGLDRHYGSVEQTAAHLLAVVPPVLRPRVGIAPDKFAARVAARRTAAGTARVVTQWEVPELLRGVPVAWLPLPFSTLRQFDQLGLRTLDELAALPATAVQARFGPAGRHAWELAGGQDDDQVRPRVHDEMVVETLTMPAPATSRETLLIGVTQLALRAFGRPALRDRQVRQARLRAALEGGASWEQTMTLREPAGRQRLVETLGLRLQAVVVPGPVETLTLELSGLVAETARQEPLFAPVTARPRRLRQLVAAVRQLKQRYGASPLYRVVEVEPWSRIPERRHALISYDP